MNHLTSKIICRFSIVSKYFNDSMYLIDKNHQGYQIAGQPMYSSQFKTTVCTPEQARYQATKLESGVTVLTESATVPSNIQLGILVDVGSRDEDAESSGATLLLKNAYLKTAINTNETVNYGVMQMSGGEFNVTQGRENLFYRASCIAHDVQDVFGVMADCAFEPRNSVACSVGQIKNEESHKLDAINGGNQQFNDHIFAAAYGRQTLGNPLAGTRSNISNLAANVIQQFQANHLSPNRVVVSATGVENHQEFVDIVSDKMHLSQLNSSSYQRQPSQYTGGQIRNYNDSSNVHIAVAFEGPSANNCWALLVANEILGNGRKTGALQRNVLDKNVFINDAQSFVDPYSDSGLFGIKLAGSASHVSEIVNCAASTMSSLRNVSEADVQKAKNILKNSLKKANSNSGNRLCMATKMQYYLNKIVDIESELDAVTASDVQAAVSRALSSPLTLVAQGGQVQRIPSYDKVSQLFN